MIKEEMLTAIAAQLKDKKFPKVKQTFERLKKQGLTDAEAKDQMAVCLWEETIAVITERSPFDENRYGSRPDKLPMKIDADSYFSDNDEEEEPEDLLLENDLLQMKMALETGAVSWVDPNLPPEIANQFLTGIRDFEQAFQNAPMITIYDRLG